MIQSLHGRWVAILTTALLLAIAPSQARPQDRPDDARKAHEALALRLGAAQSLRFKFETENRLGGKVESRMSGSCSWSRGGRVRLTGTGELLGREAPGTWELDWVADGKTLRLFRRIGDHSETRRFPVADWQDRFLASLPAHSGIEMGQTLGRLALLAGKPEGIVFSVDSATASRTEGLRALSLTIRASGYTAATEKYDLDLQLDAKTGLPARLVCTLPADPQNPDSPTLTFSETYSDFTIDGVIDPKTFEVPKE